MEVNVLLAALVLAHTLAGSDDTNCKTVSVGSLIYKDGDLPRAPAPSPTRN